MSLKIFLTGATGYIGGETLHQLASSTSPHAIACLVREPKAALVAAAYPSVRVVVGDLDDAALIEKEAREADVVLTQTIGLPQRPLAKGWKGVSISGSTLFAVDEIQKGVFGEAGGRFYDNVQDIDAIHALIQASAATRPVDKLVTGTASSALVVGPVIYGRGRGPGNTRSIQGPDSARYTLTSGHGFRLGAGKSGWSNVHVQDLGELVVQLVETASKKTWTEHAVYVPENGYMTFGHLSSLIAQEAHRQGYIKSPDVDHVIDPKDGDDITPHGAILLGTNAKQTESLARKTLGWNPQHTLEEEIADMVRREAEAL